MLDYTCHIGHTHHTEFMPDFPPGLATSIGQEDEII